MPAEADNDELVMTLVEEVLALPVAERESCLRRISASNPAVYEDVRRRVEWERQMDGFLLEPVLRRPASPDPRLAENELVGGRFRILRAVGQGGMGRVYEAQDEKLDRRVALKCARAGFHNRMSPEARAALEVSHPNVCKLHELHTAETSAGPVDFLTMEFVDGLTMAERIQRDGPLPPSEGLALALQLCDGLAQAHRQGVIHGDIKPGNVILSRTGEGLPRAVLTDFGLAHLGRTSQGPHVMSAVGGTVDYMAPELFQGAKAGVASDIYALGVLFHAMLTGKPACRGESPAAAALELPTRWRRVIRRCLETEPDRRFASVEEVRRALAGRRSIAPWIATAALAIVAASAMWFRTPPEASGPPVRLAVLPVVVEGDSVPSAAAVTADVAGRLSGLRRNFTVIPPADIARNRVDTPEKAAAVLSATHALSTRVNGSGGRISATIALSDAASGSVLRTLKGTYADDDTALLAQAIIGTVSGAFGLRKNAAPQPVSKAAYPFYARGIDLLRRDTRGSDEAISLLEEAKRIDPRSALPYAGLAEAQMQKFTKGEGTQWLDLAAANVAKAKSIDPDAVPVLLVSGRFQYAHSSYEQAIAELTRAAQLDPADASVWRMLAGAYQSSNRPAEAIDTYRKAIATQPGYYGSYADFGNFFYSRGQFREAEQMYRRVTELAPRLEIGHMNLGLALAQEGRLAEAEGHLLEAVRLRPTAMLLMNVGALYYLEERFVEAVGFFERSVAMGSSDSMQYRDLGDGYRQLGRKKDAVAAYRKGRDLAEEEVARNPREAINRAQLALICAELGDSRRADFELSQALSIAPENASVLREAAIAYEALGRRDRAVELLNAASVRTLSELSRHPDMKGVRAVIQDLISKKRA